MVEAARRTTALVGLVLLAACVPSKVEHKQAPILAPVKPTPTPGAGPLDPVGRTARALEAEFGKPSLDVREGTARKLQFAGPACVLDAYLYPPRGGGDPIVTYVDARLPDGRDMDRASCIAALAQRGEVR